MTEHDLSTLLRDHVSSDEPAFAGPAHAITRGRRTVRTRRLAAGAGAAAILAVALVVPQVSGSDDRSSDHTGVDPATQAALDTYDATAMPRILDEAARAVFTRSVPDLGEAEFFAGDGQYQSLPPRHYDKASTMSVSYGGDSDHQLSVDLTHGRSYAEGDPQEYCDSGLADGYYLACTVESDSEGNTVISRVTALRGVNNDDLPFGVDRDELATIDPDKLWFDRSVKVVKSETFVTFVGETVKAPDQQTAESRFQSRSPTSRLSAPIRGW